VAIDQGRSEEMNKAFDHGWQMHPDRLLENLRSNRRLLKKPANCERLELYHRASSAIRVGHESSGQAVVSRIGLEEGVAVRLAMRGSDAIGFAAASGGDLACLRWAIDRACEHHGTPPPEGGEWPLGEELLLDRDSDGSLPPEEDVISWLRHAYEQFKEQNGENGPGEPLSGWVEAVTTVESWVADGGPLASRSRTRGWAVARGRPRPLLLAARRWTELPERGWTDLVAERDPGGDKRASKRAGQQPILFTAEIAADLVSGLVRGYLSDTECLGVAAGSGWKMTDYPASPQALFGGKFDDAMFPTERRLLADGREILARIHGPGQLRRSSFRDPPQSQHSHLIVGSEERGTFERGLVVTGLTIHPLAAEDWVLEFEGSTGRAVEGYIRTDPRELIRRCVASVGPSRLSHRGVKTPALLFEGLKAEF
jgi:hypothetical protein